MFQEGNKKPSAFPYGNEDRNQHSSSAATEKQRKSSESASVQLQIPQISLPKGGGALKGIDEKFEVNACNGLASFSIPVPLSPGRNGFIPTLAMSYNSGGGNGIYGLGWSCEVPAIQRRTDKKLPQYQDDADTFILSGVEDLVPYLEFSGGEWLPKIIESGGHIIKSYRPRTEGSFSRIEQISHPAKGTYWKITTNNNVTTVFGRNNSARIADPDDVGRIFKWLPEFSFDNMGNWIIYEYKNEDLNNVVEALHEKNRFDALIQPFVNRYLKRVKYGNRTPYFLNPVEAFDPEMPAIEDHLFELVLDFGEHDALLPTVEEDPNLKWFCREDPFSEYRAGFEIRTYRLCQRMLIFHRFEELGETGCLVRSMDFTYAGSSIDGSGQHEITYLEKVSQTGYIRTNNNTYSKKTLPPVEFEYQALEWNRQIHTVSQENILHSPVGISNEYQWVDLYGEGISGMLTEQGDGWHYKNNLGDVGGDKQVRFSNAKPVIPKPSFAGLQAGTLSIQDLDGNGQRQVVVSAEGLQGYFELTEKQQWGPFRTFEQRANLRLREPNIRMFDVNGDGQPDIVMSEENVFTWFPSLGKKGYEAPLKTVKPFDEEKGPAMVFADPLQSIFIADINGDGLPDILRIRNGEVSYWPNLGYGKFGSRISMSNAPIFDHPDAFNPNHIQLADISGTGAADLIYLAKNKFKAYLNLSGNAFSNVHEIDPFCRVSKPGQVTIVDLLGTGTACILWSSDLPVNANAPMQYIDLMNSKKPHLLTKYKNNLGKETSIEYKSSTHFYIKDKLEGNPWITRLSFPVQVVHKTSVEEKISKTKFTIEYRYHHGYYDHAESEFRGFGMVEQTDTQHFTEWKKNNGGTLLEKSEKLFQAPVLTKTWFHTGAFLEREKILTQFENEYWYNVFAKNGFVTSFTEPVLPDGKISIAESISANLQLKDLSVDEYREALRACKGMMLRQEIFSLDTPAENPTADEVKRGLTPYAAATHNCHIQVVQPRAQNKYAVFTVAESEALTIHYERNADDPRISHTLNIAVDDLGLVLEKASVVYPRVQPDATLPQVMQDAQAEMHITYTLNSYTNDIVQPDLYRLRQAAGVSTYELSNINQGGTLYLLSDFDDVMGAATTEIPYSQTAGNAPSRRLIEDLRTTYFDNALATELAPGLQGETGLKYQQYQLAFTPGLIQEIFSNKIDAADPDPDNRPDALMPLANFVHFHGDSNWWIPSGIVSNITTGETINDAKTRFFAPILYADAAGSTTTITYYKNYFLLISAIEDELNNITKVEAFNFRTLQPSMIRDHNDNLSQVLYDELGLLKAVALLGKDLNQDGIAETELADDLAGLEDNTSSAETTSLQNFFKSEDSVPLTNLARTLLQQATVRYAYDYEKYAIDESPIAVVTISRAIHHVDENPQNPGQLYIEFEYTNGTGQVVMVKMQAEPGIAKKVTVNDDNTFVITTTDTSAQQPERLRWIGNGRIILNNKGKPVKQFEPFFSVTPFFEDLPELVEAGVTPILFYDPLGRIMKTELPEGSFTKMEFTSWKRVVYDVNDTSKQSKWYNDRFNHLIDAELLAEGKDPIKEKDAAVKTSAHDNTPFTMHLDSLGRDALGIEHNIVNGLDEFYPTFTVLDIEGNIKHIEDARQNTVMRYKYDMLGHGLYQQSMDAGERWSLNNVMGKPVKTWDSRGHVFFFTYDGLQRPLESRVTGGDGPSPLNNIFSKAIYGEGAPNDKLNNLRGKIMALYDTAGKVETPKYDSKGNLLITHRRFSENYKDPVDWSNVNPDAKLENQTYTSTAQYDALKRVIRQVFPDNSIMEPSFNEMSLLEKMQVTQNGNVEIFVKKIDYNEKGQRSKIVYGNDVTTNYFYDRKNFRLIRLQNKKLNNESLQDYYYTYDPSGNITHIQDKNIPAVFFDNQKIDAVSVYTYDAVYRLSEASGREHTASLAFGATDNWNDLPFLRQYNQGNLMAWRNYTQHYQYDSAGNLKQVRHLAPAGNWTRDHTTAVNSNRMLSTQVGSDIYNYSYHPQHGFIVELPHLQVMRWTFKDQLQAVARQAVNAGTPETTYYVYDGSGVRVRKITERLAANGQVPSKKSQRLYLGALELYQEFDNNNAPILDYNTLHVQDDTRRIAMIDTRIQSNNELRLVRYQFPNHMNSASLEADAQGNIISYEEFHPFGTTAYQAMDKDMQAAAKRYRYTGMERDDESGMQYHIARYYLPWLGRWLSTDPTGIADGLNIYRYAKNNPLMFSDTNGNDCGSQPEVETERKKDKKKEKKEAAEKAALAAEKGEGKKEKASSADAPSKDGGSKGSSVGDKILEGLKGFGKWIGEAFGKIWDWLKGAASTLWNWIKKAATSAWEWLKGAASSAWNWIKGAASTAWNWIKDTSQAAWNWIKNAAKSAWEWTKQKAAEFWNWFAGDDGFLEDFFEVVGHLTWGLLATLAGLLFTLFNFTIGNLIVAIHNSKAANAMDQWEYASLTIGGPANENDIIGNYGGILNLGGAGSAVTLGPFVFFQGSPSSLSSVKGSTTSIQGYFKNETPGTIYQSHHGLRTADHEEGHEDQNLLYGPLTLLFGLIFSLIPNAAGSPHSSGWYWYDRQANKWSGTNSPFNPKQHVH